MKKLLSFLLVFAFILPIAGCSSKEKEAYDAAVDSYNNGDYTTALSAFSEISDYKDAADYITKCEEGIQMQTYNAAVEAMDSGEYETALAVFEQMPDYLDAANYISDCQLMIVENYLDAGDYATLDAITADWDQEVKDMYIMNVQSATRDYFHYTLTLTASDYENNVALDNIYKNWGHGDFEEAKILEDLIALQPVYEEWDPMSNCLYDYYDSYIGELDLINEAATAQNTALILSDYVPAVETLAGKMEADYGDDAHCAELIAAIRDMNENLKNECEHSTEAISETYFNQRVAALEQCDTLVEAYNVNYADVVSAKITEVEDYLN